jgi:predicted nuclease of predicted toxin-antitoxin system
VTFLFDHDVPDDLAHVLRQLGHTVVRLREVLPTTTPDPDVLAYAFAHQMIMITCNRDDFVALAQSQPYHGIIVVFRRKSRTAERAALVRLLENAGEQGLTNNINFA